MKTLNKKILTSCLALMMAVAMAVPAFATELSTQETVVALAGYNRYDLGACSLNLYGNSTVYNNQNVNLYTTDQGSNDQIWLGVPSGKEAGSNKKNRYVLKITDFYITRRYALRPQRQHDRKRMERKH